MEQSLKLLHARCRPLRKPWTPSEPCTESGAQPALQSASAWLGCRLSSPLEQYTPLLAKHLVPKLALNNVQAGALCSSVCPSQPSSMSQPAWLAGPPLHKFIAAPRVERGGGRDSAAGTLEGVCQPHRLRGSSWAVCPVAACASAAA